VLERSPALRIVLVDDHALVREGLRRLLESDDGFEVVGEATNGAEAITLSKRLKPDVLVLDVSMPRMSGLEALREMKNGGADNHARALLLTASIDRAGMLNAVQLGARGIVLKSAASQILIHAIRTVARGDYWLDREPIHNYVDLARRLSGPATMSGDPYGLTHRQREIIRGVVEGLNNREIAERLGISEHTAKHHLTQVFNKTGVSSRVELALLATQNGLVEL
jgi:two-component system, NarL family, nitrate/nitrite response regulator NarL